MNKRQWKKLRKELPRIGIAAWLSKHSLLKANEAGYRDFLKTQFPKFSWRDFLQMEVEND